MTATRRRKQDTPTLTSPSSKDNLIHNNSKSNNKNKSSIISNNGMKMDTDDDDQYDEEVEYDYDDEDTNQEEEEDGDEVESSQNDRIDSQDEEEKVQVNGKQQNGTKIYYDTDRYTSIHPQRTSQLNHRINTIVSSSTPSLSVDRQGDDKKTNDLDSPKNQKEIDVDNDERERKGEFDHLPETSKSWIPTLLAIFVITVFITFCVGMGSHTGGGGASKHSKFDSSVFSRPEFNETYLKLVKKALADGDQYYDRFGILNHGNWINQEIGLSSMIEEYAAHYRSVSLNRPINSPLSFFVSYPITYHSSVHTLMSAFSSCFVSDPLCTKWFYMDSYYHSPDEEKEDDQLHSEDFKLDVLNVARKCDRAFFIMDYKQPQSLEMLETMLDGTILATPRDTKSYTLNHTFIVLTTDVGQQPEVNQQNSEDHQHMSVLTNEFYTNSQQQKDPIINFSTIKGLLVEKMTTIAKEKNQHRLITRFKSLIPFLDLEMPDHKWDEENDE